MQRKLLLIVVAAGLLGACQDELPGWLAVETGETHGPRIVYDVFAKPVPEVPFPNDSSLRVSDETPSGLQLNVSLVRPTAHQRNLRRRLNQLDGFGVTGPAWLSFDGPLDLTTVTDDSVMMVNIEPGHPREGERVPLDLGRGYLPLNATEDAFFGMDPDHGAWSLLFPDDNVGDLDGDGEDEPLTHYEVATHTLILKPLLPLAPAAQYAVIVTRDVMGWTDGAKKAAPVRSPFEYKLHLAHAFDVPRALELADVPVERLAFAWTFTTRDVMRPMQALRDGVYGRGPLARMAELAPARVHEVRDPTIPHDGGAPGARDNPYIVQADFLSDLMSLIGSIQGGGAELFQLSHVDYVVFGSFASPDLRVSERRDLDLNLFTGEGNMAPAEVPFVLSVPKVTEAYKPPFPVLIYFHGTGTSRMESLAVADEMARQGFATIAFDSVGHGPLIPDIPYLRELNPDQAGLFELLPIVLADMLMPDQAAEVAELPFLEALDALYQNGLFAELAVHGRNEDENGNGHLEAAEAFYFADPFRMCASFHQDLVDFMVLVRLLRELDPAAVPATPLANPDEADYETLKPFLLAGDFNADGVLDVGGPTVALGTAGTSLGGIHAIMAAAIEPEVTTTTPIVAGGGLTDVMMRSSLRMVIEQVLLDALGTVIVGCPGEDGQLVLTQGNDARECRPGRLEEASFGSVVAGPGAKVTLTNMANGVTIAGEVNEAGGFSLAVETDKGDPLRVTVSPVGGEPGHPIGPTEVDVVAVWEGAGYERSTPDFRRAVGIMQHALDQCDPLSFASALFADPPPGHSPTNVLMLNAVGDRTVPNASSVALAAAVGLLGIDQKDTLARWRALRDSGLVLSQHVDVDDIRGDNPPEMPSLGPARPIRTPTGQSAIRFADVNGGHSYIAGKVKDGFDWGVYHRQVMALYHRCGGRVVPDLDPECLATATCPLLDDVGSIPGCSGPVRE